MTAPQVSIVVPCRNEARHIEAALASMLAQQGVEGDLEIIVADGASDDGTRATLDRLAAEDARVRVIDNPAGFVSQGLNTAIRAARGEIVVRMDTHSVYAPDYVACCLRALRSSGADNVGGPALTRAQTPFQQANALAYHSRFAVGGARFHAPDFEGWVDTVPYGCWRRQMLLDLGLFDEDLVRNQDDELNLRLVRAGGRIWQTPSIRSWYYPRGSLRALFRQYEQYGYWKVRVIRKHRRPAAPRHLVPGAFVGALGLSALLAPWIVPARAAMAALALPYAAANLAASFWVCRGGQWRHLLRMPAVFAAYHFGYGLGFLRGGLDFVLLDRAPAASQQRLTR